MFAALAACAPGYDGAVPVAGFDAPPNISVTLSENFGACMGIRPDNVAPGQDFSGPLIGCNFDGQFRVRYRSNPTSKGAQSAGPVYGEGVPAGLYPEITVTSGGQRWILRTP